MKALLGLIMLCCAGEATSQAQQKSPLFRDETPLDISFAVPLNDLKREEEDSVYFSSVLSYRMADGTSDRSMFSDRDMAVMKRYMKDFFTMIRNDNIYKQRITNVCRTTN